MSPELQFYCLKKLALNLFDLRTHRVLHSPRGKKAWCVMKATAVCAPSYLRCSTVEAKILLHSLPLLLNRVHDRGAEVATLLTRTGCHAGTNPFATLEQLVAHLRTGATAIPEGLDLRDAVRSLHAIRLVRGRNSYDTDELFLCVPVLRRLFDTADSLRRGFTTQSLYTHFDFHFGAPSSYLRTADAVECGFCYLFGCLGAGHSAIAYGLAEADNPLPVFLDRTAEITLADTSASAAIPLTLWEKFRGPADGEYRYQCVDSAHELEIPEPPSLRLIVAAGLITFDGAAFGKNLGADYAQWALRGLLHLIAQNKSEAEEREMYAMDLSNDPLPESAASPLFGSADTNLFDQQE